MTGCSHTTKVAGKEGVTGDPLLGDHKVGPGNVPGPPVKTGADVPPIPSASSSPSTVILAAGIPLPGSRPLAIGQPEPITPDTTGGLQGTLASKPGGTTLSRPEPIVQAVPRADVSPVLPAGTWGAANPQPQPAAVPPPPAAAMQQPAPVQPPPAAAAAQPAQDDPFLQQLRARGVTWQRAENVAGGVKFSCIVPNRLNPTINRVYEATGPDYPSAVRAVLWKLDQQQ